MATTVHIGAGTYKGEKRRHGRHQYGFYCNGCDEFFATAVSAEGVTLATAPAIIFEFEKGVAFECPFCHRVDERTPSEMASIVLTTANKKRPPPPPGAN